MILVSEKTQCLGAMLCGQVSRSNAVVVAHRALRDGYGTPEAFDSALAADREQIVSHQKGFAYVSGGQADWLDLLRPLCKTWSGFERRETQGEDAVGPVTRWFRTNTFYRKPRVVGRLGCRGDELASVLPKLDRGVVFLLGPFSFLSLVENSFYSDDPDRLVSDYTDAVVRSLPALSAKGYSCVLWLEPAVAHAQSRKSFEKPENLSSLYPSLENFKSGIHFPLADAGTFLSFLEDSAADFLGVDCRYTSPRSIQTEKDVLFGVSDADRIHVETPSEIQKVLRPILEKSTHFSGRYFVGNS